MLYLHSTITSHSESSQCCQEPSFLLQRQRHGRHGRPPSGAGAGELLGRGRPGGPMGGPWLGWEKGEKCGKIVFFPMISMDLWWIDDGLSYYRMYHGLYDFIWMHHDLSSHLRCAIAARESGSNHVMIDAIMFNPMETVVYTFHFSDFKNMFLPSFGSTGFKGEDQHIGSGML